MICIVYEYLNKAIFKKKLKSSTTKNVSFLAICPFWNKYTILMNQNKNHNIYIQTQNRSKFHWTIICPKYNKLYWQFFQFFRTFPTFKIKSDWHKESAHFRSKLVQNKQIYIREYLVKSSITGSLVYFNFKRAVESRSLLSPRKSNYSVTVHWLGQQYILAFLSLNSQPVDWWIFFIIILIEGYGWIWFPMSISFSRV